MNAAATTSGRDTPSPDAEPATRTEKTTVLIRRRARLGHVLDDVGLLSVLIGVFCCFSVAAPYFNSIVNYRNLLTAVAVTGIMAAVSTLVLVTGALDLSVGSIAAFSPVITVWLLAHQHWPTWVSVLLGVVAGTVAGLANGVISVAFDINPIITTIGMLSVLRGLTYVLTGGTEILVQDRLLLGLGSNRLWGLPWGVWIMLFAFLCVALFSRYTVPGRNLYAIGANARASKLSGLPLGRYRIAILSASGLSAAVAGLVLIGQAGTASSTAAVGYELQVVTAVLLGGTSLTGGKGRIGGTLIAVLIIGVLNNGLTLMQVPGYYQTLASGLLLLVAVAVDRTRDRLRQRMVRRGSGDGQ